VDECPHCGGFWLDAGELAAIRGERQTEMERRAAVEQYITEMTEQSLASVQGNRTGQLERSVRISRLLRFSIPIQYQTGE
jgi:Zn-finger nucleic acid-binding protein